MYWMKEYGIRRRSISDAVYIKHNPDGDPFKMKPIKTISDAKLLGLGLGIFWGEGNKANPWAVRVGNTDAKLLTTFMEFLVRLCGVDRDDLRFGLQIFSDIDPKKALKYWITALGVPLTQFYKVTVTKSGSIGTYRKKSQFGVVTLIYNNKHLRDIVIGMLPS